MKGPGGHVKANGESVSDFKQERNKCDFIGAPGWLLQLGIRLLILA